MTAQPVKIDKGTLVPLSAAISTVVMAFAVIGFGIQFSRDFADEVDALKLGQAVQQKTLDQMAHGIEKLNATAERSAATSQDIIRRVDRLEYRVDGVDARISAIEGR